MKHCTICKKAIWPWQWAPKHDWLGNLKLDPVIVGNVHMVCLFKREGNEKNKQSA